MQTAKKSKKQNMNRQKTFSALKGKELESEIVKLHKNGVTNYDIMRRLVVGYPFVEKVLSKL